MESINRVNAKRFQFLSELPKKDELQATQKATLLLYSKTTEEILNTKKLIIALILILGIFVLSAENVKFGRSGKITELGLTNSSKDFSSGTGSITVNIEVNSNDLKLVKTQQNYDLFKSSSFIVKGIPKEPTLYLKTQKVVLEKNAKITGVQLISGEFIEIENEVNLAPAPQLAVWNGSFTGNMNLQKKSAIYSNDEFYPMKTVSNISGKDNENTIVYLQIYPIQYNPVQKKTVLIKNAVVQICYENDNKSRTSASRTDAQNVIITPQAFESAANDLANLHETLEGIDTEVITIEWIESNYSEAADPDLPGYANGGGGQVTNYNYSRAKKIIAFFQDNHENLESITLLGDAQFIPPSYYVNIDQPNDYDSWIPTDMFYASPDYDFILNYEIGRLPAETLVEAEHFVQKLENWKNNMDANWFDNVHLLGGSPFGQDVFFGEMITLYPVNQDHFSQMNIGKKFETNGSYSSSLIQPLFSDENTGIIFHAGHGHGSTMPFDDYNDEITYAELMNLPVTDKYPILISLACANGGYDNENLDYSPFTGSCFAEGLLRSNAGGIAYYGSSRSSMGVPIFIYNGFGELEILGMPYITGMISNFAQAYSDGNTTIGSIFKEGFNYFIQSMNPDDYMDYYTFFETILFGDPAFSMLPPLPNGYDEIEFTLFPSPHEVGVLSNRPTYFINSQNPYSIDITGITNSPSVNQRIFELEYDYQGWFESFIEIVNNFDNSAPFTYSYAPTSESTFMVCYEAEDGKESRLYFQTENTNSFPPTTPVLSEIAYQGNNSYELNWQESVDLDGEIASYTLKEMKTPIKVEDECENFDKWICGNFVIAANGSYNGTSCFVNDGQSMQCQVSSKIPVHIDEGDEFSYWREAVQGMSLIQAFIEPVGGEQVIVEEIYHGIGGEWQQTIIDLSDYIGQYITVGFKIERAAGTGETFKIDDIYPASWFEEITETTGITELTYNYENQLLDEYFYQIKAISDGGEESGWSNIESIDLSNVGTEDDVVNAVFSLNQNYPNPFNSSTTISFNFTAEDGENAEILIYNLKGQKVKTISNLQIDKSPNQQILWNGTDDKNKPVSSGIYFYKLKSGGKFTSTKKMILMR